MIRILIADNGDVVRTGIRAILRENRTGKSLQRPPTAKWQSSRLSSSNRISP